MSRIAKQPVEIISGVDVSLTGQSIKVKGKNGELALEVHKSVKVDKFESQLEFSSHAGSNLAMAATMRTLVNNMVIGVSQGFERKLELIGVGYRAQVQGRKLNLSLGFSHPVEYEMPDGITIEAPTQTEIIVKGADKQKVGQVSAEIRAYRPPEPYKGKGVKYSDEVVLRKEAKKK